MMKALYDIFLFFYPLAAHVLAIRNQKARKWIAGRQNIFGQLAETVKPEHPVIWVHCASLGEFEQGRPLMEALRKAYPGHCLILTFFSPSGYEVQQDYEGADYVFYMPLDSSFNASCFYDIVQPVLVVFVKYEFWYYYIHEAHKRQIPMILASGIFRKDQPFFRFYGALHRKMLQSFTAIFVQDSQSLRLLQGIGINQAVLAGDTRFDRVLEIAAGFREIEVIQHFCGVHTVIVAGSTWSEDDKVLSHFANANPSIRFVVAPHDISESRIRECKALYRHSICLSQWQESHLQGSTANVLIVDSMGLLSRLYHYATIAYVGGGFGADGVHNVLEPAVYGKPVVIGPEYGKYLEAVELVEQGGAFAVSSALELEQQFCRLTDDAALYQHAAAASRNYVHGKAGATDKIMAFIQEKRLLTT